MAKHYVDYLIEHTDLPGHRTVERMTRFAPLNFPIFDTIGMAILFHVLARNTQQSEALIYGLPIVIVVLSALNWMVMKFSVSIMDRNKATIFMIFAGLYFIVFASDIFMKHDLSTMDSSLMIDMGLKLVGYSLVAGAAAVAITFGLMMGSGLISLLFYFGRIVTFPVSMGLIWFMNRAVKRMPAWKNNDGSPMVTFNYRGTYAVNYNKGDTPIFVPHPALRDEGRAAEKGVPVFSFKQFSDRDYVNKTVQSHSMSQNDGSVMAALTAMGGAGMVLAGASDANWGGMDLNPATGLPTVAGVGSPDVAGNQWGQNDLH